VWAGPGMAEKYADVVFDALVENMFEFAAGFMDQARFNVQHIYKKSFSKAVSPDAVASFTPSLLRQQMFGIGHYIIVLNKHSKIGIVLEYSQVGRAFVFNHLDPQAFQDFFGFVGKFHSQFSLLKILLSHFGSTGVSYPQFGHLISLQSFVIGQPLQLRCACCVLAAFIITLANLTAYADTKTPLPSWNDGTAKKQILAFVKAVTDHESGSFVRQEERIAVFDNDGTLWAEQPMYFQLAFALDGFDRVHGKAGAERQCSKRCERSARL